MTGEDEFTAEELAEFERQAIGDPPYAIGCEVHWEKPGHVIRLQVRYSDERVETDYYPTLDAAAAWAAAHCPEMRVKFPLPDDGLPF